MFSLVFSVFDIIMAHISKLKSVSKFLLKISMNLPKNCRSWIRLRHKWWRCGRCGRCGRSVDKSAWRVIGHCWSTRPSKSWKSKAGKKLSIKYTKLRFSLDKRQSTKHHPKIINKLGRPHLQKKNNEKLRCFGVGIQG